MKVTGNQPGQCQFFQDKQPGWAAYLGGLGSGKTFAGARRFLWFHELNRCPGLIVAPTYGDIWRFTVPALIGALEQLRWQYRVWPSAHGIEQYPHVVVRGEPILLISAEKPERFAGFEVGHIWIDEGARIPTNRENPLRDAPTQIRTRLRHPRAKRLMGQITSTHEGMETYVYRDFIATPLPNYRWYLGRTALNSALPPSYLQDQMASLPPELVKQYLDGEAVSYQANRAHPTFSKGTHVDPALDWIPGLPAHLGADYNVSPMCWIVGQDLQTCVQHGGRRCFHVLDEVVLKDFGQVDAAVHAADERGWASGRSIVLHPDRSAKNRSTVGDPEFVTMQRTARALGWSYSGNAAGANPPITVRINTVSRLLRNALGQVGLYIHPRCTTLIENMERTGRLSSGAYDPGSEGKFGHILDALGYGLWDLYQPNQRAGEVTI